MAASPLQLGEAAIFDYFLDLTSDTEDQEAYREEFPAVFEDEKYTKVWTLHFKGGGTPGQTQQQPGKSCGIVGDLIFDGAFTNRAEAQTYACLLRENFPPAAGTLTNVNYVMPTTDPMIERAVVKRKSDQTTSGEARVWRLTAEWETGIQSA